MNRTGYLRGTRSRFLAGLLLFAAIGCLTTGLARRVTSKEPPKNGPAENQAAEKQASEDQAASVIFPPDRCVLLSGTFDVIASGSSGKLEVDGKRCQWEPVASPVRLKRVRLAPGRHELCLDDRSLNVVVALNEEEHDGPSDWPHYKFHSMGPGADRCDDCHETTQADGQLVLGDLKDYTACFECHESVEFDVIHSHPLEPLEPCQMCHDIHGSSREALLKAPIKELCDKCHES